MYVALLWFDRAFRSRPADRLAARRARLAAAAAPLVPDSYTRHRAGGEGWGLDLHAATQGVRWPVHAEDAGVTAVSLGIPLGADTAAGPLGLARRALGGGDVGAEVVPPFSMIACDADGTVAVVQDWLGMGRLFVGEHDDLLAFCTRPSLLAMFLHDEVAPDVPAWETYAASGHFGGDSAPVRGVRLLGPGERYTVRPAADGWQVRHGRGTTADELVGMGLDRRGDVEKAIAEAADGIAAVSGATYDLCGGDLILGLSGGKDSRVLAAAFVGAGRLPALHTNADTPAEGDTAARLVGLLRARGLAPEHRIAQAAPPAAVLRQGLAERARQLLRHYDFQFPSSYLTRPGVGTTLRDSAPRPSLTGAAGELATGYWYPAAPTPLDDRAAVEALLADRHLGAAGDALDPHVHARQRDRLADLLRHGAALGLVGAELADHLYLTERMRRWSTSAYHPGMVTPFLAPSVVTACFALTPEAKRERRLHAAVISRFVPEWAEVPFVSASTGRSTVTRIWQGDGAATVRALLDTVGGRGLGGLLRPAAVGQALDSYARSRRASEPATRQYVYLAMAEQELLGPAALPAGGVPRPVPRRPWWRRAARAAAGRS